MADISAAQQMASYFGEHPPLIRGRVVYIQYSNHEELKVEASQQVPLLVLPPIVSILTLSLSLSIHVCISYV